MVKSEDPVVYSSTHAGWKVQGVSSLPDCKQKLQAGGTMRLCHCAHCIGCLLSHITGHCAYCKAIARKSCYGTYSFCMPYWRMCTVVSIQDNVPLIHVTTILATATMIVRCRFVQLVIDDEGVSCISKVKIFYYGTSLSLLSTYNNTHLQSSRVVYVLFMQKPACQ